MKVKETKKQIKPQGSTAFFVLFALSITHLLNDTLQSVIPAIYPVLKDALKLNFTQIGLITLTFQIASSVFQPVVGWFTDKKPQPYSLSVGMTFTMIGIFCLSFADSFITILISVFLTGIGSSIFHPEASRLAYMASGGKYGTAQALFQVGGNMGGSLGPLMAALIIAPFGRSYVALFCILSLICILIMLKISKWYKHNIYRLKSKEGSVNSRQLIFSKQKTSIVLFILLVLIFSKYVYMASMTNYYTFFLIHKFGISVQSSQLYLFIFLFAVAAGTFIGGPVGDKIGRKYVIWISILGVAPFTLAMPYANLTVTCILSIIIGFILSSAFSAILVYAQELMPGKVGMIAGFFFGFAFGIAGISSAILGNIADQKGIEYVYNICSYLPLIGLITVFLPNLRKEK